MIIFHDDLLTVPYLLWDTIFHLQYVAAFWYKNPAMGTPPPQPFILNLFVVNQDWLQHFISLKIDTCSHISVNFEHKNLFIKAIKVTFTSRCRMLVWLVKLKLVHELLIQKFLLSCPFSDRTNWLPQPL